MILPSRSSGRWLAIALVLAALLTASYVLYRRRSDLVHGGSLPGLAYGVLALVLILVLLTFGVRKRAYRSTVGTLDDWLQAHIYLGLLSVVVVLFHAGFRFHDRLATAAFAVLATVVASGVAGARLYAGVPRRLTAIESNLTREEISAELNKLERSMARLAAGASPPLRQLHQRLTSEARPRPLAGWRLVFFGAGRELAAGGEETWEPLLALVDEDERPKLRQLLVLARQHRELHGRLRLEQRYRNLLEVWLYLHLPLSILLLVLVAFHVVIALYYRGLEP